MLIHTPNVYPKQYVCHTNFFIYNFVARTVNGRTYLGVAKGKEEAAQEFEEQQQAGENVGLVESR